MNGTRGKDAAIRKMMKKLNERITRLKESCAELQKLVQKVKLREFIVINT